MKPSSIAFAAILVLLSAEVTAAQGIGRLRDRALDAATRRVEQRIEERVEQKIDDYTRRKVDQAFDNLFAPTSAESDNSATEPVTASRRRAEQAQSYRNMFSAATSVKTADRYVFSVMHTMQYTSFQEGGRQNETAEFDFYFQPDAMYTGTVVRGKNQKEDVTIVYDLEHEAMIMFMNSDGNKFSIAYGWAGLDITEDDATDDGEYEPSDVNLERIGTKTIFGYTAEGFRATSEDVVSEFWVSSEAGENYRRMMRANATMPLLNAFVMTGSGSKDGLLMEMTTTDQRTGERVEMRTTAFNTRTNLQLTRSEYPPLSF